jgi:hypothetical protein
MIYSFDQNNSGGSYSLPAKHIIVKDARDESHAIEIALKAGMYLDGVADGLDCDCCGDRWYGVASEYDRINEAIADASYSLCTGDRIPQWIIVDDLDIDDTVLE